MKKGQGFHIRMDSSVWKHVMKAKQEVYRLNGIPMSINEFLTLVIRCGVGAAPSKNILKKSRYLRAS